MHIARPHTTEISYARDCRDNDEKSKGGREYPPSSRHRVGKIKGQSIDFRALPLRVFHRLLLLSARKLKTHSLTLSIWLFFFGRHQTAMNWHWIHRIFFGGRTTLFWIHAQISHRLLTLKLKQRSRKNNSEKKTPRIKTKNTSWFFLPFGK